MKLKFLKVSLIVIIVAVLVGCFVACSEASENSSSVNSSNVTSNPYGSEFQPTTSGSNSLENAASGLQAPDTYSPGYTC